MDNKKIRVAITHGDTNGIGYELIFKVFAAPEMLELCTPIIYGSPKVAAYHRKALNIEGNFSIINKAEEAEDGRVNLLPVFDEKVKVDLGMPSDEASKAAVLALDKAITDYKDGHYDVLVTCRWTRATCTWRAYASLPAANLLRRASARATSVWTF
jgi:4-hydroxythreonine-4-phosphate dehydrogenase